MAKTFALLLSLISLIGFTADDSPIRLEDQQPATKLDIRFHVIKSGDRAKGSYVKEIVTYQQTGRLEFDYGKLKNRGTYSYLKIGGFGEKNFYFILPLTSVAGGVVAESDDSETKHEQNVKQLKPIEDIIRANMVQHVDFVFDYLSEKEIAPISQALELAMRVNAGAETVQKRFVETAALIAAGGRKVEYPGPQDIASVHDYALPTLSMILINPHDSNYGYKFLKFPDDTISLTDVGVKYDAQGTPSIVQ